MTVNSQEPNWNGKLIGILYQIFFQFFGLGRCYFKTSHSHSTNSSRGLDPYTHFPQIYTVRSVYFSIPPPNSSLPTPTRGRGWPAINYRRPQDLATFHWRACRGVSGPDTMSKVSVIFLLYKRIYKRLHRKNSIPPCRESNGPTSEVSG